MNGTRHDETHVMPGEVSAKIDHFAWRRFSPFSLFSHAPLPGVVISSIRHPSFLSSKGYVCNLCCATQPIALVWVGKDDDAVHSSLTYSEWITFTAAVRVGLKNTGQIVTAICIIVDRSKDYLLATPPCPGRCYCSPLPFVADQPLEGGSTEKRKLTNPRRKTSSSSYKMHPMGPKRKTFRDANQAQESNHPRRTKKSSRVAVLLGCDPRAPRKQISRIPKSVRTDVQKNRMETTQDISGFLFVETKKINLWYFVQKF